MKYKVGSLVRWYDELYKVVKYRVDDRSYHLENFDGKESVECKENVIEVGRLKPHEVVMLLENGYKVRKDSFIEGSHIYWNGEEIILKDYHNYTSDYDLLVEHLINSKWYLYEEKSKDIDQFRWYDPEDNQALNDDSIHSAIKQLQEEVQKLKDKLD